MLSRLVIAFLPSSKRLLILWLQSSSAVILEPKKTKSITVSTVSPSICYEVMEPDAMIFVFWILSFKPTFSLSSFTFIRRLFSPSLLTAMDCTPFPSSRNTLPFSLLSVFVGILFYKAEGPVPLSLTIGLVARIWCSQCCDPASSLWLGKQAPLQAAAGWGHQRSVSFFFFFSEVSFKYLLSSHQIILSMEFFTEQKPLICLCDWQSIFALKCVLLKFCTEWPFLSPWVISIFSYIFFY